MSNCFAKGGYKNMKASVLTEHSTSKNDILLNKFPSVIQLSRALESPKIISNINSVTYENPLIQLKSKDADSIFNAIITLFDEKGIISKITSFASDGASVMLGKRNEVAAKIAERNPYLFTTHYIVYRLVLACNSAEKQVSYCKHVENIIKSIYSFFSSSSKRQETL
ncbi:hypothetical protein C1645_835408 [Glomus cerebriforme]|uniref:DUF4371 domain-containing protein n=1 Tax=Glomus cerebriforme TaxID=658196 RepID=A0A397S8W3_9GLOM|nr:hypothetical protein C1645_835408 [Glomus cerebriforme]